MSTFQLLEEPGSSDWTPLVVDDNTVVIAGRFRFKGRGQGVGARLLSNVWVRHGETWKIKSTMLRIYSGEKMKVSSEAQPAVETTAALKEAPAKAGIEVQVSFDATTASPSLRTSTSEAVQQPLTEQTTGSPIPVGTLEEPKASGISMHWLLLLLISGFGLCAFLYERRRQKIKRSIECVDSMLG